MNQNAILPSDSSGRPPSSDVASRVARRTLSRRNEEYAGEVRRLLDAALQLMRQQGTTSKPRVADIVAAAGLSNDAFYRHFPSKDALVTAILDDGTMRLTSYLTHQMGKQLEPREQVRRWVAGVLAQAAPATAATTLAVLWNGGGVGDGSAAGRHFASAPLAALLREPFTALGSVAPHRDAALVAHAVLGTLSDYLWEQTTPTKKEVDAITAFCFRAITAG